MSDLPSEQVMLSRLVRVQSERRGNWNANGPLDSDLEHIHMAEIHAIQNIILDGSNLSGRRVADPETPPTGSADLPHRVVDASALPAGNFVSRLVRRIFNR